jgi:tripartite-type tricarboxylate transporter receptor subunit TctC
MKLTTTIRTIAFAACAGLASLTASAQAWPGKQPIRFVVPYPPGGASDVTARVLAQKLGESLKQTFVVENRAGANGIIALEVVAHSAPDGYTILMANLGPNAINPGVYSKLPYDSIKDFAPITLTSIVPQILVVSPTLPIKSVAELIAYAKAHPDELTYASAGNGSSNHLSAELFDSMAGVKLRHVPYKGDTPAMTDVMGGQVDVMFPTAIAAMPQVRSGKLRAIGVSSSKRIPSLPDVPAVAESLPGFEAVSWGGVMAPAGTPQEIVKTLNTEINRILKMPDVAVKLQALGAEVVGSTPEEFATYLRTEIAKWSKVAHDSNVKLD